MCLVNALCILHIICILAMIDGTWYASQNYIVDGITVIL